MTRRAAVAGMFYEGDREGLVESIERCFVGAFGPGRLPEVRGDRAGRVVGLVCPHAGYMYSGGAAAWAYSALAADGIPDTAVILGPNHHGLGPAISVSMESEWVTPLGSVRVDLETAHAILERSEFARIDELAHIREHSIEVQLPFIQYIGGDRTKIVPISLGHLSDMDTRRLVSDLGSAIAKALLGKSAVIIASTDFTHYESRASAQAKDSLALERIAALDAQGLLDVVNERSITMCGALGTAIMLQAAKARGATTADVLTHYTSGDVVGDMEQVVGYAAVSVEK